MKDALSFIAILLSFGVPRKLYEVRLQDILMIYICNPTTIHPQYF